MFVVSPQGMSGRSEAGRRGQARGEFSQAQRAGLDARQADQDRTLIAMHALEAALGEAAPGREQDWHQSVLFALAVLDEATTEAAANAERPDSLLSDIARTQPRLRNRARGVRLQYRHLREVLAALRQELGEQPGGVDRKRPNSAATPRPLDRPPGGRRCHPDLGLGDDCHLGSPSQTGLPPPGLNTGMILRAGVNTRPTDNSCREWVPVTLKAVVYRRLSR